VGTPTGAVKVVVAPLAVWVGENEPQNATLPHLANQSTPALATSLLTVATIGAVPLTDRVEGGFCTRDTDTVGVEFSDSLALVPTSPQPAVAIETARRNRSGRCTPQERLKVSFSSECAAQRLSAELARLHKTEPQSLQSPRFVIKKCPFQRSMHNDTNGRDQRPSKPTVTTPIALTAGPQLFLGVGTEILATKFLPILGRFHEPLNNSR
jgi:hypothetical protein